jgi:hypothetical protein
MQTMTVGSWAAYKTLISAKGLSLQYYETDKNFEIFAPEAQTFLWAVSLVKGTSDGNDFVNNFQSAANAPMTIGGGTIQAHIVGEAQVFADEAIRDTSPHNSATMENQGFRVKTIIIDNQLNQSVSLQMQGSRNGSGFFNVGSPFVIAATTLTYQSSDEYFPHVKFVATCSVAPTSGNLNAWIEQMGT